MNTIKEILIVADVGKNEAFETLTEPFGPYVRAYPHESVGLHHDSFLCFNLTTQEVVSINGFDEVKIYNIDVILKKK